MAKAAQIGIFCLAAIQVAHGALSWVTPAGGDITKSDIKENTAGNIYTYKATGSGTVTLALDSQSVANTFIFTPATGVLSLKQGSTLNFETNPTHKVIVTAKESTAPTVLSSATVTIQLVNVNEAPRFGYSSATKIVPADQTAGSVIDTVQASDEDTGNIVSHSIISGNGAADLVMGTTSGIITVASGKTLTSANQYALVIKAVDNAASPLTATMHYTLCIGGCNSGAGSLAALGVMTLLMALLAYMP